MNFGVSRSSRMWVYPFPAHSLRGRLNVETHLYGLPEANCCCCCSVVMMGFRSCFRRFLPLLPLDGAAPATCFALLMAAFLMLSLPFMVRRWRRNGGAEKTEARVCRAGRPTATRRYYNPGCERWSKTVWTRGEVIVERTRGWALGVWR